MTNQPGDRSDDDQADESDSPPLDVSDTQSDAESADLFDESLIMDLGDHNSLLDRATHFDGLHTKDDRKPQREFELNFRIPEKIGKYEVRKMLGQGGVGAVYLAFDPLIERDVAIKVLRPGLSEDPTTLLRFLSEARSVGQLNHPNAIAIYDVGEEDHEYFIVMEFAKGGTVLNLVREKGSLPLTKACDIAIQAARGLEAAHQHGLIHRDVKPENLMLTTDGVVKLVDFGLAKLVDRSGEFALTTTGQVLGTPVYMSPEQIMGENADARTDIYSLGATFFQLLTGRPPFMGQSVPQLVYAHLEADRPDPAKLKPELPGGCAKIIAKAMAVKPEDRYASAGEMVQDLNALLQSISETEPSGSTARILIVESSKLASTVVANLFRKAGCGQVDCLHSVGESIDRVLADPPDVLITARQLQDASCDVLFQRTSSLLDTKGAMCIELTTESPLDVMAEAKTVTETFAVLQKQAPEEAIRAIHYCTDHALPSQQSCSSDDGVETNVLIVSEDSSVVADPAKWLEELGVPMQVIEPLELGRRATNSTPASLVLWLGKRIKSRSDLLHRLHGPIDALVQNGSTLAVIDREQSGLRLRAVFRPSLMVVCCKPLDRARLERLL